MLEISTIFNQLRRKITIVILASLVWLISLPATSVQADGYYSEKDHKADINKPYYSSKERRVTITESARPYYSTKDRKQERVIRTTPATGNDYIESGKRPGEVIPKDLETRNR